MHRLMNLHSFLYDWGVETLDIRLLVETILLAVIAFLLLQKSYKPRKDKPLSEKEVDELCQEWEPEPLCPTLEDDQKPHVPVITSSTGAYVEADGKRLLNLASFNYLGFAEEESVKDAATGALEKYGCGSCGPRGFYGTIDVHLDLEEKIAEFMGVEEAILYSYDVATAASVIPAFSKKGDLIVCDEGVSYAIQNGLALSRSTVVYFKHNDMEDLRRVLEKVRAGDRKGATKPLNRRFLVVEGIYYQTGEVANLKEIHALKEEFCFRLLVDESFSLGVLGAHGRGACEDAGLGPGDVEIITASMGNAIASVGGFCCGTRQIVDHQRLSGAGYCFSASLPPFLAATAVRSLDMLPGILPGRQEALSANARAFRAALKGVKGLNVLGGDGRSPVVHLQLQQAAGHEEGDRLLQRVADRVRDSAGVLIPVAKYSVMEDARRPPPSLRASVLAVHSSEDLRRAAGAIKAAAEALL